MTSTVQMTVNVSSQASDRLTKRNKRRGPVLVTLFTVSPNDLGAIKERGKKHKDRFVLAHDLDRGFSSWSISLIVLGSLR